MEYFSPSRLQNFIVGELKVQRITQVRVERRPVMKPFEIASTSSFMDSTFNLIILAFRIESSGQLILTEISNASSALYESFEFEIMDFPIVTRCETAKQHSSDNLCKSIIYIYILSTRVEKKINSKHNIWINIRYQLYRKLN